MGNNFDIIIPHLHLPETERLAYYCLTSIRRHSKDYRLIWIDNGGTAKSDVVMDELAAHNCMIIRNTENLGFVKAVNQGLAVSSAPYIVLLNNDTEVDANWLEQLRAPLRADMGMSGPRTTARGSWQGHHQPTDYPVILPEKAMLAFFCVMMRRDVFEKVGYLDEDFGVGFGDDDNYCARVQQAGFKLVLVPKLLIKHYHRTTFKLLYSENQIKEMQDKALALHYQKQGDAK